MSPKIRSVCRHNVLTELQITYGVLVVLHQPTFLRVQRLCFRSWLPHLAKDGIQPDLYRGDLGSALVSLCSHLLRGVLHALLALGITAGQVRFFWYFPEVLVSRA